MDRISYLPDDLQHQILSRMSFPEAITMSCLSRRWRNVRCSLPNLSFVQGVPYGRRSFEKFVSETLELHDESVIAWFNLNFGIESFENFVSQTLELHDESDIEWFSLNIDINSVSPALVNSWISFAVSHNVKKFCLRLDLYGGMWKLPCCLLTCKTLRVLILYNINLSLPETIGFPKLETLRLEAVEFNDDNSANHLLSSCLLLEVLVICETKNVNTLRISGHNLKSVRLSHCYKPDIEISAPNLRNISYFGKIPNMSVESLSSVVTVDIDYLSSLPPMDAEYERASNIMMGLHNVSKMNFKGSFFEFLTRGQASLAPQPTSYRSLKHLQLDMYPSKKQVQVLILLLGHSPYLKHLSVYVKDRYTFGWVDMDESWQLQGMSTDECSLKSLKSININFFHGSNTELELVKYLVENASSLVKMDITYSSEMIEDDSIMVSVGERISKFTKASPSAVISCILKNKEDQLPKVKYY